MKIKQLAIAVLAGTAMSTQAAVEVTNVSDTKDVGLHRVFTWADASTSGKLTVLDEAGRDADILVVGGGGAGGLYRAGGGGGGGVVYRKSIHLAKGVYTITIGAGGVPDVFSSEEYSDCSVVPPSSSTTCGGTSSIVGDEVVIEAFGGGGGGTFTTINNKWSGENSYGLPGGCGGGAAGHGETAAEGSHGYDGGVGTGSHSGAGGGGAGGVGQNSNGESAAGGGGDGFECDITGASAFYAGGGGGGAHRTYIHVGAGGVGGGGDGAHNQSASLFVPPKAGVDGLGGGGGGGYGDKDWTTCGGARGGCGTVIVKVYDEARVESDTTIPGVANLWGVGSMKTIGKEIVCTWTNTAEAGAFEVLPNRGIDVEMLLVGGGGAGGFYRGGGGGGGGVVTQMVHLAKGSYTILVGQGGIADRFNAEDYGSKGNMAPPSSLEASGGNSELKNDDVRFVAYGGGAGGTASNANNKWHGEDSNGADGGCGGGSAGGGTVAAVGLQGGNGGLGGGSGGGGGGGAAPEDGTASTTTKGVAGGAGLVSSITGQEVTYGGGGGGGASNQWTEPAAGGVGGGGAGGAWRNPNAQTTHTLPVAGEDGLGGGGGGGLGYNWSTCGGANGGSGVVVLRFVKSQGGKLMVLFR